MSVSKAIQQGRQAKNLTQKDLATKINEKPQIVNEYESGKAVPNQQILGKMERILGIRLRGKDIGSPLGGPKK
jgi:putative transcription factor